MIGFERKSDGGGNKDEIRKLSRIVKTPSTAAVHGHHRGTHKTDLWPTITGLRVSVNSFLFIYTYPRYLGQSRLEKTRIRIRDEKSIMRKRASAEFPTALACGVKVFIKTPRRVDRTFFKKTVLDFVPLNCVVFQMNTVILHYDYPTSKTPT